MWILWIMTFVRMADQRDPMGIFPSTEVREILTPRGIDLQKNLTHRDKMGTETGTVFKAIAKIKTIATGKMAALRESGQIRQEPIRGRMLIR